MGTTKSSEHKNDMKKKKKKYIWKVNQTGCGRFGGQKTILKYFSNNMHPDMFKRL